MPSTIADFDLKFSKMHPEMKLATDASGLSIANQEKTNPYRVPVTIPNSGKSVKSNYLICVKINTAALYRANKCSWTFADLRVYDTDGVTPLSFCVEAPNTEWTVVFVRVPSIAAADKIIYFEYGNPSLKSLSNRSTTLGAGMNKSTLMAHFRVNEVLRQVGGGDKNNFGVHFWDNKKRRFQSPIQKDITKVPTYIHNQVNGQPCIRFSGVDDFLRCFNWHNLTITDTSKISIFTVMKPDSVQGGQRLLSWHAGGGYVISHWWNSGASRLDFLLANDGGTINGVNTGVTAGAWQLSSCHWRQNTTNGMQTRRNGAIVAQRNSSNSPLVSDILTIGSFNGGGEYYDGDVGDIIIFADELTSSERTDVDEYMNRKFRLFSTSDIPDPTIGVEATISTGYSFQSYAPLVSEITAKTKISSPAFGMATMTATAVVQRLLENVVASGSNAENWHSSTNEDEARITHDICRKLTIDTSGSLDLVTIARDARGDGSNYSDLSKYPITSLIDSTTTFPAIDSDFIDLDLCVGDAANIDQANSFIRYASKNIVAKSLDFSDTGIWQALSGAVSRTGGVTDPDAGTNAWTLNFGAPNRDVNQIIPLPYKIGDQITYSIYVKGTAGQSILIESFTILQSPYTRYETQSTLHVLNGSWQRVTLTTTINAASSSMDAFQIYISTYSSATATSVDVAFPQAEFGTAATVFERRTAFEAGLDQNVNDLISDRQNVVRIRKQDFTAIEGTSWQSASQHLFLYFVTSSGSQDIFFGFNKLAKNFDDDPQFAFNNGGSLAFAVSSDQDVTYYQHTFLEGRIRGEFLQGENVKIAFRDYLEVIKRMKFSDFDSFPEYFALFDLSDSYYETITDYTLEYYTFALQKILGFVFPSELLDIDLDMNAADKQVNSVNAFLPTLQFFWIRSNETIGDKIEAILQACAGYLTWDAVSGKYIARNGYQTWDAVSGSLPAAITPISLFEYGDNDRDSSVVYNYIEVDGLIARRNRVLSYSPLAPQVGYGSDPIQIQPTIGSDRTTIFIPAEINGAFSSVLFNQFYVDGWAVSVDQVNLTANNTGVTLVDAQIIGDQLALSFQNTSGGVRYLYALGCGGDTLIYDYITNWSGVVQQRFTASVRNQNSIDQVGVQQYDIDPRYAYVRFDNSGSGPIVSLPNLHQNLVNEFTQTRMEQADVKFDPNIRHGQRMDIRDKSGKILRGHIVGIDTYATPDGDGISYVQTVQVRKIENGL